MLLTQTLSAQLTNVMISDQYNPEEPAICINPKNPSIIMAGSNLDNWFLSTDSGQTWVTHKMTSDYVMWGDPCIVTDTAGDFYFFHLSNYHLGAWIDRIVAQKYSLSQQQWVVDTFTGLNGNKAQDKEWATVDPNTNAIYLTWTQFDSYGSSNPQDSSSIMFSKSVDAGATWSQAIRINEVNGDCIDSDNTVEGAVPAVGPNGEVYVSWAGPEGLVFDKSTDGGNTWLNQDIFIDSFPGGWDLSIPGISRCNGLPVTVCDLSAGPYNGTIYVNWTDQRNGATDTDVWLAKSADGGNTWSSPIRVNDDMTTHHQFFTWMTIDQSNGYLYFVFYDRRNYNDNQTDVYLAVSRDGGNTFQNIRISESPFIPRSNIFFGDYNNISVHNGMIRPIWTRLDSATAQLSVWTALIDESYISSSINDVEIDDNLDIYPNPMGEIAVIAYKLKKQEAVTLKIMDVQGKLVKVLVDEDQHPFGMHIQRIYPKQENMSPGVYFFILETESQKKVQKFVVQ
jgi:hypothetical protein